MREFVNAYRTERDVLSHLADIEPRQLLTAGKVGMRPAIFYNPTSEATGLLVFETFFNNDEKPVLMLHLLKASSL